MFIYYRSALVLPTEDEMGYLRLSRFNVDPETLVVDPDSEFILFQQHDPHTWHNGGCLRFGTDGFLYVSVGDAGEALYAVGTSQQLDKYLMSGVLRIDVDMDPTRSHPIRRQPTNPGILPDGWPESYSQGYYIPDDNPWVDPSGQTLEEFWALGLRSPHRMAFDSQTGDLWVGDTGFVTNEEISIAKRGYNMQWSFLEGLVQMAPRPDDVIGVEQPPVHAYPSGAVVGGFVYRGTPLAAQLGGKYLFIEFNAREVRTLTFRQATNTWNSNTILNLPELGLDLEATDVSSLSDGEVYLLAGLPAGSIFRLRPLPQSGQAPPSKLSDTGAFTQLNPLTPSPALMPYGVMQPLWSDGTSKNRWVALPNDGTFNSNEERIQFATNDPWTFPPGTVFVKHFELGTDDSDPTKKTKLETRFLVIASSGDAYGLTYRWNGQVVLIAPSMYDSSRISRTSC